MPCPPLTPRHLRELAERAQGSAGHRFWESIESAHLKKMADALRKDELRAPVAGVSHWRREPEFCAAQAAPGLDLIDDRLYWGPLPGSRRRSARCSGPRPPEAWKPSPTSSGAPTGLMFWASGATRPSRRGRSRMRQPTTCWVPITAMNSDWDGIVRRGIFIFPQVWGEGPAGTKGGEDIFQIAEVTNGSPHIYALWPHAASLFLRGRDRARRDRTAAPPKPPAKPSAKARRRLAGGWDSARGRLLFDTPFTQGAAGWIGGETASFPQLELSTENPFAVLVATSISTEPIASTKRLLVSAIARVEPTGFRWANGWKREVADPGRPPFLQEPVTATITWRRKGNVRAYVLDQRGRADRPGHPRGLARRRGRHPADRRQDARFPLGTDGRVTG